MNRQMNAITRVLSLPATWLSEPRFLIGGSLVRICLGFIVFVFFALHISERQLLWGTHGIVTIQEFNRWFGGPQRTGFNLYTLANTQAWFEVTYWIGLIVALLFTIGCWTRITTPMFALFVWSIYHRNPWVTNGGTRLLCIVVIYLVVADLGAYLSVDASLRGARPRVSGWLSNMLHNTSILLVAIQLCCVYIFSTFYKLDGPAWQQGTGLYYALMDPQFISFPFVAALSHNVWFVTLGSYGTLLYQSAFPWLILHPRLKYPMIIVGIGFHAGIALFMGLWWFSAVLIACETVLLTDAQYIAIGTYFHTLFDRIGRGMAIGNRLLEQADA